MLHPGLAASLEQESGRLLIGSQRGGLVEAASRWSGFANVTLVSGGALIFENGRRREDR